MAGTTATSTVQQTGGTPASRGAAQRVQRYYNKASGRMETAQQMRAFRPQGHPQPHMVSKTVSTTRTTSANSRPAPAFDLLRATPAQIEARARAITQAELASERQPFQQRHTELGQEQAGAVKGVQTAYAGLGTQLQGQSTAQAASAKTYENEAADQVLKTEQANPKATAGMSESERRQTEADRTLLMGLAGSAQKGTQTRQEAEANFLTNLQATAALKGQGAVQNVEGSFGKAQRENAARQSQAESRASGRYAKYVDSLEGEQAKLRIAGAGLGLKEGQLRVNEAKERTTTENQRAQRRGEGQKIQQGAERVKQGAERIRLSAKEQASKEATEGARRGYYNAQAKKLLAQASAPGGKPLTLQQLDQYKGEIASIFNFLQNHGPDVGSAAKALQEGGYEGTKLQKKQPPGRKPKEELAYIKTGIKIKEPLLIQVALESINKGYVSPALKQQLRERGLPDSGWSEMVYKGAGRSRPVPGTGSLPPARRRAR